ncbi:MAG: XdhC family protein [Candidatus Woesearchaeota archaeon]
MKLSLVKDIFNKNSKKMALATIINASGSSPRDSGAAMVIFEDEEILGTIGGGEVEKSVYDKALEYLKNENYEKSKKLHFDISNEEAAEVGGICGGKVDILLEIINLKEE